MRHIQLQTRLRILERILIIHDTDLDDLRFPESRALAVEGGAAIRAEVGGDVVASIVTLACDGLGLAGGHGETITWHDDVGTEG